MLCKCANEACSTPFRRLREGKLFQVETEYFGERVAPGASTRRPRPWRRVEHYWLCDACSSFVTLTFDQNRGVITMPLPSGIGKKTVRMVSTETNGERTETEAETERRPLKEVQK
jgi:hypothetical protein